MAANKGYPSKERDLRLAEAEVYVTAEPIRQKQHGLSVLAHQFVYSVGSDAVEASSTTKLINATAHVVQVGDILRFTSGALNGQEVKVLSVSSNTITLAEVLPVAPSAADTFQILRHKYPVINPDGSLPVTATPGPLTFEEDGVSTTVSEDTVTPANSKPLPVKLMGMTGAINVTAGDLNVDLDFATDSCDVSGSSVSITGSVAVTGALTDAELRATPVPVSGTVSTGLSQPLTDAQLRATAVPVSGPLTDAELRASAVPVSGTFFQATQPVSAVSLPLPTGASTEATLSALNGKVTAVDTDDVTITSSVLPTGASTEATLAALNAKVTAVDTGAVVVASSALPTGAATEATLSTLNGKVPANLTVTSTRLLVDGSGVTQPVSGTVTANVALPAVSTFVRNDYSSVNVTTSAYVELIASTAATYKRISIFDSSGQTLKIALGAAASESDLLLVFPGGNGDVDVNIPSGTRISIRAVSGTASVGEICINFFV